MAAKTRKNRGGRPPAGPGGEKVRDYKHQLTSRLRGDSFHTLVAISTVTNRSYRDVLTDAIELYLAQRVTRADRAAIEDAAKRAMKNCPRCQAERER